MNYNDDKWKKKRIRILKRDNYLCVESKRYGERTLATVVHHIYPVEFYPELKYEEWNLISLSSSKHDAMHDRKTHALTALGESWKEKRATEYEQWKQKNTVPAPI